MTVVHIVERIDADGADQKIQAVDISSGDIPKNVGLEDHLIVFVEVVRRSSVYGLDHAPPVAVIRVFDHSSVLGLGANELVPDVVGVGLDKEPLEKHLS